MEFLYLQHGSTSRASSPYHIDWALSPQPHGGCVLVYQRHVRGTFMSVKRVRRQQRPAPWNATVLHAAAEGEQLHLPCIHLTVARVSRLHAFLQIELGTCQCRVVFAVHQ